MSQHLKDKLAAAVRAAESYGDFLDAKGVPPTSDEWSEIQRRIEAVKSAKRDLEDPKAAAMGALNDAKAFMNALAGQDSTLAGSGFLRLDGKAAEKAIPRDMKALGSLVFPAEVTSTPIAIGQPATSLLDVIPAKVLPNGVRTFTYLRQTTRTNNAAPVAAGATKPTSVYTLTSASGQIRVIAHLSEPMDVYDLSDSPNMVQFLNNELRYGLALAVTNQVLNGTGVAPQIEGIGTISGTQAQAFVTDRILTSRAAITKLEVNGLVGEAFVLHPNDWEAIETAQATGGEFLLESSGAPINRVERRLWGVRVVLDTSVTAGTGWLIAKDALTLRTDGEVRVEWSHVSDDFTKNQVRARCEGRFGLQVERPLGLVELDLTE